GFARVGLTGLAAARDFDALVMIEALQHFADLDALVGRWERALGRGVVLVADFFASRPMDFARVPFHRSEELASRASRAFELVEHEDASARALPTARILRALLAEERAALLREFAGRATIAAEIEELAAQLLHLGRGLENGDLCYELLAFRRR